MNAQRCFFILVGLSLILSACQFENFPPIATATPVLPTSTPVPTGTPLPPTATNTPFVPKATIKIAVAVPLTGDSGGFGSELIHASEMAVLQLSNPLELMGYDVEVVPYDDRFDLDTAVDNAKELINDPDILCGVGHFNSSIMLKTSEIYHQVGLAFVSPSVTNPDVTDRGYPEINRLVGRDDVQGVAGARFANERGAKAIYLIHDSSNHGIKNAGYFEREAKQLGLTIAGKSTTDNTDKFESVIQRILKTNADFVYFAGSTEPIGNFIREVRAAGYAGVIFGNDYAFVSAILDFAGSSAIDGGGLYYSSIGLAPVLIAYTPYAYDATGICMKAIEEASKAKGGEVPTREEVAKAIRALVDYRGITGTYNFTTTGDPKVSVYQVYQVTTIDPNKWNNNPLITAYEIEFTGK